MNELGYRDKYDQFILAGASLGYTDNNWRKTLEDHINISIELHHIKEIYIIDHMDCGAYKKVYGVKNQQEEFKLHEKNIKLCIKDLKIKYPNLKYKGFVMKLNGSMEEILKE